MTSRTFVFKGPADTLRVQGVILEKGKQFDTDNIGLIEMLSTLEEVEEVKPEKAKSRHSDAVKS
jgi:hypothetical protein